MRRSRGRDWVGDVGTEISKRLGPPETRVVKEREVVEVSDGEVIGEEI